jgi:cytochrome c oxidase subunit 2
MGARPQQNRPDGQGCGHCQAAASIIAEDRLIMMMTMARTWILALSLALTALVAPAAMAAPAAAVAAPAPAASPSTTPAPATEAAVTTVAPAADSAYVPMKPKDGVGQPVQGGIDFQPQVSETGKDAYWINNAILIPMMFGVSVFVLGLLLWVVVVFRRREGREPSKTTHNTLIEVVWTAIPVLILVVIAVPSIGLIAKQYEPAPENALTVKVTGYQWYWGYSYPDNGGFEVIANMLAKDEAEKRDEPFQLATDNRMVIPVGVPVKMLITSADVIHSWALPAAWFKMDAVPGRINEKVLKIDEVGVYYGQCSELCGARHGFMPITVEVLPQDKFEAWVRSQGGEVAGSAPAAAGAAAPLPAATSAAAVVAAPAAVAVN